MSDQLFGENDTKKLPVISADFLNEENISLEEIFSGYKKLKVMTYSCEIGFLAKILSYFEEAEIIFGYLPIVGNVLKGIAALQEVTLEYLAPYFNKKESVLSKMKQSGALKLYVSNRLSHGKLFILEGENKNRVITGSVNATYSAFSGNQNEVLIKFDNNSEFLEKVLADFDKLKNDTMASQEILDKCLYRENEEINILDLPVAEVIKTNKLFVQEAVPLEEYKNIVDMSNDINNKMIELDKYISGDDVKIKDGKTIIAYEDLIKIQNLMVTVNENIVQEKRKLHNLQFDFDNDIISIDGKNVNDDYDDEKVQSDIKLIIQYFNSYNENGFSGNVQRLKEGYFKLLNYMFLSPFMCYFRNIYLKLGNSDAAEDRYQLFAILYGGMGSGKSSIVRFIIKLMMNKATNEISKDQFTESNMRNLRFTYKGFPLYIDDLDKDRFSSYRDKIIKDAMFGRTENIENYPCCVISLNETGSVQEQIKRRSVMIRVDAKHNTDKRFDGVGNKLKVKATDNFYKKYLGMMFPVVKELKEKAKNDINGDLKIDLYNESSKILVGLFREYENDFVKELDWFDYFSDKEISYKAIRDLMQKYKINKKSFKKVKKENIVIFYNEVTFESENRRLCDELPHNYNAECDKHSITINRYDLLKDDFWKMGKVKI